MRNIVLPAAVAVLLVVVYGVVYLSGGSKFAYTHLAYFPIILGAFLYGPRGGVCVALLCAVMLGPLMPFDVATGTRQPLHSWLIRGVFFLFVGGVAGKLFQAARHQSARQSLASLRCGLTGLPTRMRFEREAFPHLADGTVVRAMVFNDIFRLTGVFGDATAASVEVAAVERMREKAGGLPVFRIKTGGYLLLGAPNPCTDLAPSMSAAVKACGTSFYLRPSFGTAVVQAGDTANDVIRRAFSAAELAAEEGVAHLEFSEERENERRHRFSLLGELRQAIDNGELHLLFQPKIRLSDRRIGGCEALLRWTHPRRGNIPPSEFIPLAEYSPIMADLTLHVVDLAVAQVLEWRKSGIDLDVSVNVSVRNLMDPGFAARLVTRIAPLQPRPLAIEITESAAADPSCDVFASMQEIAAAGIELHVDDYGTGMSSLAYLKKIPATQIKIDQSFIRNMSQDMRDRAMVKSTILLCRELGLAAVAEGVEDDAAAEILHSFGCHYAQGFHFAKPLAAREIRALLADGGIPQAGLPGAGRTGV
ncbi:EAL domain-containing protein [Telmatospirillum sp. J64-1]|uniref:EAL domain-containing protein n=1 Tax=Telmatospirillum sp. J64-1 TaxID=2502183 RepID=UPI00163DA85D|nr:EAL domain-containing protein [Telmatospirillum sp. J64-1]